MLAAELPETAAAAAARRPATSSPPWSTSATRPHLAERAVAEVRREKPDAAFNDLLRASLNRLSP